MEPSHLTGSMDMYETTVDNIIDRGHKYGAFPSDRQYGYV